MQLNVPYVKQPKGSVLCGPACATMVLKFFGSNKSLKKVTEEIQVKSKLGITMGRISYYFLEQKLGSTIQAWPAGIDKKYYTNKPISGNKAVETLRQGANGGLKGKARMFCKETITAVKNGASIIFRPITLEDFRVRLGEAPVVISLDAKYFLNIPRKTGHFVLAYGITDPDSQVTQPYLHVHDPLLGPEAFLSVKNILNACNSWFGTVLYTAPKAAI